MYCPCPIYDQRTQVGTDGRAPEDGNMDCVPTSLASMAAGLLGSAQNGDAFHDAVYGQGYIGMQNPARYVSFLADKGLRLTYYNDTPANLLSRAVNEICSQRPVLLSIPSDWNDNPPTSQYAHMVAGCDVNSSAGTTWDRLTLTAMNPWTAAYQTQTLNWWQERLATCAYKGIWVMERTTAMGVPANWKDDGTTLTAPNGVITNGYIRQHIIDAVPQWPADLVPVALMFGIKDGWQQEFIASRSVIATTTGAVSEQAGPDYRAELAAANAEIAALQAKLKTIPAPPITPAQEEEIALGKEVEAIDTLLTTHTASS